LVSESYDSLAVLVDVAAGNDYQLTPNVGINRSDVWKSISVFYVVGLALGSTYTVGLSDAVYRRFQSR